MFTDSEFTNYRHESQSFVDKRLAGPTLEKAASIKPDHSWELVPVEETCGIVYLVGGRPKV
jgi:hypothetical protein